jgi:hypothetical protein
MHTGHVPDSDAYLGTSLPRRLLRYQEKENRRQRRNVIGVYKHAVDSSVYRGLMVKTPHVEKRTSKGK